MKSSSSQEEFSNVSHGHRFHPLIGDYGFVCCGRSKGCGEVQPGKKRQLQLAPCGKQSKIKMNRYAGSGLPQGLFLRRIDFHLKGVEDGFLSTS